MFELDSPRLFDRKVDLDLVDPHRHLLGEGALDREVGCEPRLAQREVGGLLVDPRLSRAELRLKDFHMRLQRIDIGLQGLDMGPERLDDSLRGNVLPRSAGLVRPVARGPDEDLPVLGQPDPRPLVVSQRPLPVGAPGPLPDRASR